MDIELRQHLDNEDRLEIWVASIQHNNRFAYKDPEFAPFQAAMKENPDCAATYRVIADWCDQHEYGYDAARYRLMGWILRFKPVKYVYTHEAIVVALTELFGLPLFLLPQQALLFLDRQLNFNQHLSVYARASFTLEQVNEAATVYLAAQGRKLPWYTEDNPSFQASYYSLRPFE